MADSIASIGRARSTGYKVGTDPSVASAELKRALPALADDAIVAHPSFEAPSLGGFMTGLLVNKRPKQELVPGYVTVKLAPAEDGGVAPEVKDAVRALRRRYPDLDVRVRLVTDALAVNVDREGFPSVDSSPSAWTPR